MRKVLIAAGLVALASAATPLMAQDAPALSTQMQATLDNFLERYAFPGATAAIILPDGTLVTSATGLADVENARAMTPQTPMLAASIGKTFVAATVLALESEGSLSRTDLLSAHLGDRTWFDALPNADSITIGQLLHHTSGLPDHVHMSAFQQDWSRLTTEEGDFDPEHLVAFVAGEAPLFEAGTGWAYSDTGYVLLGLAIEEVTGQPWQSAVFTRFLEPLGLTGTFPRTVPTCPASPSATSRAIIPSACRNAPPTRRGGCCGTRLWNLRAAASRRHRLIWRAGGICCLAGRQWTLRI